MRLEPGFRAAPFRKQPLHHPPEALRMIELDPVRHFMRGQIIEHVRRRQHEPPRKRERAFERARAPTAPGVAHADAADLYAELGCVTAARLDEFAPRFALEKIHQASPQMLGRSAHAQDRQPVALLGPHRAARLRPVLDRMRNTVKWDRTAGCEEHRSRQAREPRRDPGRVAFGEGARFAQTAAPRHGQHRLTARFLDTEIVVAGARVANDRHLDRLIRARDQEPVGWLRCAGRAAGTAGEIVQPIRIAPLQKNRNA